MRGSVRSFEVPRRRAVREFAKRRYHGARRRLRHWTNAWTDRRAKLLVVLYHRVLPEVLFNPFGATVSVATFRRQLETLARRFPVISLAQASAQCRAGVADAEVQIVLTFDDGYWDNYDIAFPLLQRMGLPAAFFVPTSYIESRRPLWDWDLVTLLAARPETDAVTAGPERLGRHPGESIIGFALRVIDRLRGAERCVIEEALASLNEALGSDPRPEEWRRGCMGWEEVAHLSRAGMEIGSHTCSHRSLLRLPLGEALDEIRQSKREIERRLNAPCAHFAFPFGSRTDQSPALIDEVRAAGFDTCLLNSHGYNHVAQDGSGWKRIIMTEETPLQSLLG